MDFINEETMSCSQTSAPAPDLLEGIELLESTGGGGASKQNSSGEVRKKGIFQGTSGGSCKSFEEGALSLGWQG